MDIEQIINLVYEIPETSRLQLQETIEKISLPKGYLLFRSGKIETSLYFIRKGIARAYVHQNDNEVSS